MDMNAAGISIAFSSIICDCSAFCQCTKL